MTPTKNIKYPVGIQNFTEIIEGGYLYVDKTGLIHQLVNDYKYVFLSRPRRFGKSLLTSTIEVYFQGKKDLFRHLALARLEKDWISYPVFRIDFSKESFENLDKLPRYMSNILSGWERVLDISYQDDSIAVRFDRVLNASYQKTGKKAVILIDEYDKPLLSSLNDQKQYEGVRESLQGFYSVIKGDDSFIRFALVSGVSKFAHLSIFSGFNNLSDISFDDPYNALCGISESEMRAYFEESIGIFSSHTGLSIEESWKAFKKQYDGYHFSAYGEDIYNPFSVLNAFQKNKITDYWFKTGTPSFLVKLVDRNRFPIFQLDRPKRTESKLSEVTDSSRDFISFLYQAGYLTIKGWDAEYGEYTLDFPNEEVRKGFWDSFAMAYFPQVGYSTGFEVMDFLRKVNNGDAEGFMVALSSLLASANSETEPDKEIHFQNMMAVIFRMLGLYVRTEIHSSRGRCDLFMETPEIVYIFEFKINGSPEEALRQIKEKGYSEPYASDPREKFLIGADFSTESRTLSGWIVDKL